MMLAKTIVGSVLVALVSAVCVATPARSTEKGGSVAVDVAADEAGSMRASVVFVGLDRELSRSVVVGAGALERVQLPSGAYAVEVDAELAPNADPSAWAVRSSASTVLHVAPGRESKLHVRARSDEGERLAQAD